MDYKTPDSNFVNIHDVSGLSGYIIYGIAVISNQERLLFAKLVQYFKMSRYKNQVNMKQKGRMIVLHRMQRIF